MNETQKVDYVHLGALQLMVELSGTFCLKLSNSWDFIKHGLVGFNNVSLQSSIQLLLMIKYLDSSLHLEDYAKGISYHHTYF